MLHSQVLLFCVSHVKTHERVWESTQQSVSHLNPQCQSLLHDSLYSDNCLKDIAGDTKVLPK